MMIRYYDGKNDDMSFQLTYFGLKKGKMRKIKYPKMVKIDGFTIMDNCKNFYRERVNNYKQMISDFANFKLMQEIRTIYLNPIIIKKNNEFIFCHIKLDEFYKYKFLKFNFTVLSNDICFHNYAGSIEMFIENEISAGNGYEFYINNKRKKFKNLKEVIDKYIKKAKMSGKLCSNDNVIVIGDNFKDVLIKYLNRDYPGLNLYNSNEYSKFSILSSMSGLYISSNGNFLYVLKNSKNFVDDYDKLIPTLENSYDIIKEYIIFNEYLCEKYKNYNAKLEKTKRLKKNLTEICIYEEMRKGLLRRSFASVSNIIQEFEKQCKDITFDNTFYRLKKHITKELESCKIDTKSLMIEIVAKTIGEVAGQFKDPL